MRPKLIVIYAQDEATPRILVLASGDPCIIITNQRRLNSEEGVNVITKPIAALNLQPTISQQRR